MSCIERQENQISKSIKIMAVLGFATLVAACASHEEEYVVVYPELVTTEPVSTSKYK